MSRVEIVSEYLVLPTGMTFDNDESSSFALRVQYRGEYAGKQGGGYRVSRGGSKELSRNGKWGFPEHFQRWQYRWETLDEAIAMAREAVDDVIVNGKTYAQWQEYFEMVKDQQES